jgi:predicted ATPase
VPPLLEREAQLGELAAAMAAAADGEGSMVVVGGEAGIGKSSLVAHLTRLQPPGTALLGACDPLGTPQALAPFIELAGELEATLPQQLRSSSERCPGHRASWPWRTCTGPTRRPWTCSATWGGG